MYEVLIYGNLYIVVYIYYTVLIIKKILGDEKMKKENLFDTKKELIDKLHNVEDDYANKKLELKNKESELWLTTNFEELGYTNRELRKQYVNRETNKLKNERDLLYNEIKSLNRELELCDSKIRLVM